MLIRFSLLPRVDSAKLFLSSLIQSSMLMSPLPPSLLGRYNHSAFDLRCSPPYMVTIFPSLFLHFADPFLSLSFVHSIMPAPYRTVGTTHLFITWNTFFAFTFLFQCCSEPLKVFFPNVFFHLLFTYLPFL